MENVNVGGPTGLTRPIYTLYTFSFCNASMTSLLRAPTASIALSRAKCRWEEPRVANSLFCSPFRAVTIHPPLFEDCFCGAPGRHALTTEERSSTPAWHGPWEQFIRPAEGLPNK